MCRKYQATIMKHCQTGVMRKSGPTPSYQAPNTNVTSAILFIMTNHAQSTMAKNALRITVLITPSIDPARYNGMNISVAGSSTVNVRIAEAVNSNSVAAISQ